MSAALSSVVLPEVGRQRADGQGDLLGGASRQHGYRIHGLRLTQCPGNRVTPALVGIIGRDGFPPVARSSRPGPRTVPSWLPETITSGLSGLGPSPLRSNGNQISLMEMLKVVPWAS